MLVFDNLVKKFVISRHLGKLLTFSLVSNPKTTFCVTAGILSLYEAFTHFKRLLIKRYEGEVVYSNFTNR